VTDACAHDGLELGSDADLRVGPDGEFVVFRLRVRCDACGVQFSWRGLNSGVPNPLEPVTSADGYELRAPVVPRPGGVVGVLALANLEHELEPPSQTARAGGAGELE
jgi:hypothetical protein